MATKTTITLVCDRCGDVAMPFGDDPVFENITLAFDKQSVVLDLCDVHYQGLAELLGPTLRAGRPVGKPAGAPRGSRKAYVKPARRDPAVTGAIRAWAADNGHHISGRGRIPGWVEALYEGRNVGRVA